MHISLSNISIDTIVQVASLLGATLTFVITQSVQKKRDRKLANREVYQQLEFASIDLFRFEASNIELIRPIWEKDKNIPGTETAEYIVVMNYVCQMLNLFEIALKFRKDKTLLPDAFGTWVAWFHLLVKAPGFPEIWDDVRLDYLPELRKIMDGGIDIAKKGISDDETERMFYEFVSKTLNCKIILDWSEEKENKPAVSKTLKRTKNIDVKELSFNWIQNEKEVKNLVSLFIENAKTNYISHSEIQEGRAINENKWAENIQTILSEEFSSVVKNDLFVESNIAAAFLNEKIVGFLLLEYKNAPQLKYALLSDIVVERSLQNNNIGENLVNWILPQLKENKVKTMFAESNILNDPAHLFLTKMGFSTLSKVFKKEL